MSSTQISSGAATRATNAGYVPEDRSSVGWRLFAGTMILIGAAFNLIDGIVAVANAKYFKEVSGQSVHLLLTSNLHAWGWVAIGIGALMAIAGVAIFFGATWARVLGVIAAGVNMIFQLAYLAHYPFWSFTIILVDVLVIYGLVVHGERAHQQPDVVLTES